MVVLSIIRLILNIMCSHQRKIYIDDILGVTLAEGVVNDGVSVG